MAMKTRRRSGSITHWGKHDHEVLVLQGGGALGAYQAGAYAALCEAGMEPDWVAGVSIGAINAALIAGNPAQRRVPRLSEFWQRVSQFSPPMLLAGFESMRPLMNRMSAASAFTFGVPGFFNPRPLPPFFAPDGSFGALSSPPYHRSRVVHVRPSHFSTGLGDHVRTKVWSLDIQGKRCTI